MLERQLGPLPLVIGITGHRDVRESDILPLKLQIQDVLRQYRDRYVSTPVLLLTGLAEGADQLAAEVALQMHVGLIAVLPMPVDIYEKDFTSAASRARFHALLAQARPCIELPMLADRALVEADAHARDRQYSALGAYVVRHTQVLIALWDGKDRGSKGGTASVVRFQLEGVPSPYCPPRGVLDVVENGPVYHVATPRESDPHPAFPALERRTLWPQETADGPAREKLFDRILERLDAFNADALAHSAAVAANRRTIKESVVGSRLPMGTPVVADSILDLYVYADTLAQAFKERVRWGLLVLFGVAGVSAVALGVYAHVDRAPALLFIYILLLVIAGIWAVLRERVDWPDKYLEYRALAEALRVQLLWQLAGLRDAAADYYLRKHEGELRWIRYAARSSLLPIVGAAPGRLEPATDAFGSQPFGAADDEFIPRRWFDNQSTYFSGRASRNGRSLRITHIGVLVLLLLALVAACFLFALSINLIAAPGGVPEERAQGLLIVVTALLVFVAAGCESFAEKNAWAEESKQYKRMQDLYRRAARCFGSLTEAQHGAARAELLVDIGREALAENADWVELHRTRVPELLVGG